MPFQTLEDVLDTIAKTNSLQPDRIAFYSYAHVPWIKGNGQRGFKDDDLPKDDVKRELYEKGKIELLKRNYIEIGMDHFALKTDTLTKAFENANLHRNFMGYTSSKTDVMIGLGVSAISDSWSAFAQNEKTLEDYYAKLAQDQLPIFRGHILNAEDLVIRRHILNLMCQFQTSWNDSTTYFPEIETILPNLEEMKKDGLLEFGNQSIQVTEKGKPFVRNICMAFDLRLKRKAPQTQLFSMTI